MSEIQKRKNYIKLCKLASKSLKDVQGAGGNVSVKLDSINLLIKPSGYLLQELDIDVNGAIVNYNHFLNYIVNSIQPLTTITQAQDQLLVEETKKLTVTKDYRASMETSLHSYLPFIYILHNHNANINVFLTAHGGKKALMKLLEDSGIEYGFIPYSSPGLGLTKAICTEYPNPRTIPSVLFLVNHGVIVSGNTEEEVSEMYMNLDRLVSNYLVTSGVDSLDGNLIKQSDGSLQVTFGKHSPLLESLRDGRLQTHIYPDSVVFGQELSIRQSATGSNTFLMTLSKKNQMIFENLVVIDYIMKAHTILGRDTNYLTEEDIDYIDTMEQEKYRKSLNK